MKVAVTDFTFPDLAPEKAILEPLGCELLGPAAPGESGLIALVADADAVITQFAPVTAAVINAMGRAKVIVRYGIGVDNVDLEAARAKGIPVCNIPDYCIDEVADHTLALILNLTRQVRPNGERVRAGRWEIGVPLAAMRSLRELAVGVVGFGRIGREVVARLNAFKCRVYVADPAVPRAEVVNAGATPMPLDELLRTVDLVTLHCPSTPSTRRMLNRESLATMKRGALLINVGRGDLVETPALIDALRAGRIAGAGLDVCDPEPVTADNPLVGMDNVHFTAHIASASLPAVKALRTGVAETVARAIRGEAMPNVVNGVKAAPREGTPLA